MEVNGYEIKAGAILCEASLCGANLCGANLCGANLHGADLRGANLRKADLCKANLREADLRWADLRWAILHGADLRGAELPHFQICPEEGPFVGYKKLASGVICKLLIPENAKRTSSLVGRKCRAEFAHVLEGEGASSRGGVYQTGTEVYPDRYDDDIRVECTNGIHFFITRKEAEEY